MAQLHPKAGGRAGRACLVIIVAVAVIGFAHGADAAARGICEMLRDKGVLSELEYNECKAGEEKEKAEAEKTSRDILGMQLPKWVSYLTPFGDVRLRYEGFWQDHFEPINRFRLRARIGLNVQPDPQIGATIRLATGNPNDPISTNQSFTNVFTRKPINLDWAYLSFKPGATFNLEPGMITAVGGKFGLDNNIYRVSELAFDDDLAPEGFNQTFKPYKRDEGFVRGLTLNTYQWIVDNFSVGGNAWMFGGQGVVDTTFAPGTDLTLAVADYSWQDMNAVARRYLSPTSSSFNSQLVASNCLKKDGTAVTGFCSGFNILDVIANFTASTPLGVPIGLSTEFAYNTEAANQNVGLWVIAGIGNAQKDYYHAKVRNKGDWSASYTFAYTEQDAVLAMVSYSDIVYQQNGNANWGNTNIIGSILRFDYAPWDFLLLTWKTHFINLIDLDLAQQQVPALKGNPTLVRMQLDTTLKF